MTSFRVFCSITLFAVLSGSVLSSKTFDLSTATLADIIEATDAGSLSSEKLVQLYIKRIEAYDKRGPKINSIFFLNENAVEEAKAFDQERLDKGRRSPLHGIPIMVKDLIDVRGFPTTAGFNPFGSPIPCLLYTSPSPRDKRQSRMPSSA